MVLHSSTHLKTILKMRNYNKRVSKILSGITTSRIFQLKVNLTFPPQLVPLDDYRDRRCYEGEAYLHPTMGIFFWGRKLDDRKQVIYYLVPSDE
ncbi:hypothetical protein CDAR_312821 [Caerostris darwini]|uniref:Uncharacterized protein n=1 Tax=Caerostris darwini TaxID=1538125 RepID=A0AAV4MUH8_9ARAC|nr:hypothetical protein CDAR_312821 [Caerostris darwini]